MEFNLILKIFLLGYIILLAAILLNIIAGLFGINTWYDLILKLKNQGFKGLIGLDLFSYIFLFIIYPFILGLISFIFYKILKF